MIDHILPLVGLSPLNGEPVSFAGSRTAESTMSAERVGRRPTYAAGRSTASADCALIVGVDGERDILEAGAYF